MSEIRTNPFTGEMTLYAENRKNRPYEFVHKTQSKNTNNEKILKSLPEDFAKSVTFVNRPTAIKAASTPTGVELTWEGSANTESFVERAMISAISILLSSPPERDAFTSRFI